MPPELTFPVAVKMVMIDLDGTLIDTAADIANCANRMLRDLGRAEYPRETVITWVGNGIPRLVKRALTGEMWGEPDAALFERAHAVFERHYAANVA